MIFAKCDKVAELTFFGADFQLLWSTLYNEDTGFKYLAAVVAPPQLQQPST